MTKNSSPNLSIKIFVEEALSNNESEVFTRAYQLKDIEKVADLPNGVLKDNSLPSDDKSTTSIHSVADLFEYVNPDNNKFSLPESDTASYDILARENEDLKAQIEALENKMKLTKGHKVKPEAAKKFVTLFQKQKRLPKQCLNCSDNRIGDPPGNRTRDTLLKRQVLCRLS